MKPAQSKDHVVVGHYYLCKFYFNTISDLKFASNSHISFMQIHQLFIFCNPLSAYMCVYNILSVLYCTYTVRRIQTHTHVYFSESLESNLKRSCLFTPKYLRVY